MKKYLIPTALMSMLTAGQAMAACPYTLDATATQFSQFSPTVTPRVKFPSVNLGTQRVLATLAASPIGYGAGSVAGVQKLLDYQSSPSTSALADPSLPASGVVAFEYRFNNFIAQLTGSEYQYVNSGFEFMGSNGVNSNPKNLVVTLALTNSNSSSKQATELLVIVHVPPASLGGTSQVLAYETYPVSQPVANTFRVGLYLNQDSNQIGLNINGVNKGYIANLSDAISYVGYIPAATSQLSSTSPAIGQTLSGTLITDASQLTLSYPSGAKDICGNTI